jgi:hypothetical protein
VLLLLVVVVVLLLLLLVMLLLPGLLHVDLQQFCRLHKLWRSS